MFKTAEYKAFDEQIEKQHLASTVYVGFDIRTPGIKEPTTVEITTISDKNYAKDISGSFTFESMVDPAAINPLLNDAPVAWLNTIFIQPFVYVDSIARNIVIRYFSRKYQILKNEDENNDIYPWRVKISILREYKRVVFLGQSCWEEHRDGRLIRLDEDGIRRLYNRHCVDSFTYSEKDMIRDKMVYPLRNLNELDEDMVNSSTLDNDVIELFIRIIDESKMPCDGKMLCRVMLNLYEEAVGPIEQTEDEETSSANQPYNNYETNGVANTYYVDVEDEDDDYYDDEEEYDDDWEEPKPRDISELLTLGIPQEILDDLARTNNTPDEDKKYAVAYIDVNTDEFDSYAYSYYAYVMDGKWYFFKESCLTGKTHMVDPSFITHKTATEAEMRYPAYNISLFKKAVSACSTFEETKKQYKIREKKLPGSEIDEDIADEDEYMQNGFDATGYSLIRRQAALDDPVHYTIQQLYFADTHLYMEQALKIPYLYFFVEDILYRDINLIPEEDNSLSITEFLGVPPKAFKDIGDLLHISNLTYQPYIVSELRDFLKNDRVKETYTDQTTRLLSGMIYAHIIKRIVNRVDYKEGDDETVRVIWTNIMIKAKGTVSGIVKRVRRPDDEALEKAQFYLSEFVDYLFTVWRIFEERGRRIADGESDIEEEEDENGVWNQLEKELTFSPKPSKIHHYHEVAGQLYDIAVNIEKIKMYSPKIRAIKNDPVKVRDYEFSDGTYSIILPFDAEDIIHEGSTLHHCVGRAGYIEEMARGETVIVFLRNAKDIESPLLTMEIKDYSVVQCFGYHDTYNRDEDIADFIYEYAQEKNFDVTAVVYKGEK